MTGREGECAAGKMVAVTKPGYGKGEGKKDLLSSAKNDDELRSMFDEWARKYQKVYKSEKEREERFAIFLDSKKFVDDYNNSSKGRTCKLVMNELSDMNINEITGFGVPGMPFPPNYQEEHERSFVQEIELSGISKMSGEELTKARIEFEEWAVNHGKVYVTEKEREKRFVFYLANKRMDRDNSIVQGEFCHELNKLGEVWAHDGTLDQMWWELPMPSGPQHESDLKDKIGPFSENPGAST